MDGEITRRHVVGGLAGACVLLLGGVTATAEPPRVVSVESEFGAVRERSADVDTRIVVENPNGRALPGRHTIEYGVTLNDIPVVNGRQRGVRIGSGRTVIETTARFDNTAIVEWWPTHVNSGEESRMRTRSNVRPGGFPFRVSLPTEETDITTDFLGSLGELEPSTVVLGDREIMTIGNQRAEWDEADGQKSPITFTTEVENVHDRPVGIDGTDYEIRMNDVVVGSGATDDPIALEPGESGAFTVEAAIDTPKMQAWWVSHLQNGQTTDLSIAVYPVSTVDDGRRRLPLAILDQQSTIETDLLGTGETVVETTRSESGAEFAEPSVLETESEWGEIRNDETDIETSVTIDNDTGEAFSELLSIEITRRTALAGVAVASGTDTVEELPTGRGRFDLVSTKSHSTVPEWWAAHLRNGERSTSRTEVTGVADVTVTTLPLDLDDRESTVETGVLDDLNSDARQTLTDPSTGETVVVVHGMTARWVDPTPERGPISVQLDMENASRGTLTIREIDVAIDINGIVLADERLPEEYEFGAGERRTVELGVTIDNSKMEAWWPTHIRRDESSEITRQIAATIESPRTVRRTVLDFLSGTVAIETDLLGE